MTHLDALVRQAWRSSPLASAVTFTRGDELPFKPARHLKLVSDAIVAACWNQGPRFLIVSMPPRYGKSQLVSRRTPAWFLANWPNKKVIVCGYGSTFAREWGRLVRNDVEKDAVDLGIRVSRDSSSAESWRIEGREGGMDTAGVGGPLTGKGADLLVIDDPVKNAEEAMSSLARDKVWDWWISTARTRLHPGGVIVVVMTRWHSDDMAGRLLKSDSDTWHEIRLPAIWESDEPDAIGRTKGEVLWPWRFSEQEVLDTKRASSAEWWESLYQQTPIDEAGLGIVYHAFSEQNVRPCERDVTLPLVWSLDFNVNPMASVVGQVRRQITGTTMLTNRIELECEVLDEIVLPHSNTPEACQVFHERFMKLWHLGKRTELHIHGDATAHRRDTRGTTSDWEIVRSFFAGRKEYDVRFHVGRSDPLVKDRTNAANAALCSAAKHRSVFIDPRCKELVKDLKLVRWKTDASGNTTAQIDKRDPRRSHVSDAWGYWMFDTFGLRPAAGAGRDLMR